jgi:hypothetical protein
MRREARWAAAVIVAFTIGALCAGSYARLATPYYSAVASLIASMHPWRVVDVRVVRDDSTHGTVMSLTGEVRVHRTDTQAAALIVGHVQVGEIVETPIVFWALLLMWPAGAAQERARRIAWGIPVFLLLEATTTPCQLVYSMARASALLAGESDPFTAWERWSNLLEAGGRFVLETTAALVTVAAARPRELRA